MTKYSTMKSPLRVKMMAARTASGPAAPLGDKYRELGDQMAVAVAGTIIDGIPSTVITFIFGDMQTSVTLAPEEADRFYYMLADNLECQNNYMREAAQAAVH